MSPSKFIVDIGKCNNEKGLGTFRGSIKVQQLFDLASLPNSCSYKLNRRKTEKQNGTKLLHMCILIHVIMQKVKVAAVKTELREVVPNVRERPEHTNVYCCYQISMA